MTARSVSILCDGPVGARILDFVLERHAADVRWVGVASAGGPVSEVLDRHGFDRDRVFPADALKDPAVLERMRGFGVDVMFLAWWPHILKPPLLGLPARFTVNTHTSHLPHCRGKDPNFWAIVEQAPFGVSLHVVTAGIDDGPILARRSIPVGWEDTGGTLYRRATDAMVELFADSYDGIVDGRIQPVAQEAGGSFHVRRDLDPASRIELDRSYTGRELLDLLRARTFAPHPAAHFEEDGVVYDVRIAIHRRPNPGSQAASADPCPETRKPS